MTDETHNRLADESSPYLLLHKTNPVDWYPWGEEALERAREEDKPIFLSVGYSTCYWCHVMERESFDEPAIAEQMNRHFVNVKVDREERPDLDEIYMTATQILTGHGGWPNSVFLTPDLKPFYAGTYFPPEDRHGRPGFPSLLAGLAEAWEGRRHEVEQQAEELSGAMRRYIEERAEPGDSPPGLTVLDRAAEGLSRRFDDEYAGFGGAPKFPTPANLFLLLEVADGAPRAAEMLHATLDALARGGIYDQVGGGFHRYATDRAWRVPHFEKMLYDNALLLELFAREHERSGDPEMERVVRETAEFLEREMTTPEGAFASAIDAETGGEEGAYYVWTRDELAAVLGDEDFTFLAPLFGFDGPPFFEDDRYVLHLPERLEQQARRRQTTRQELLAEIEPLRRRLLSARSERERPLTDDKVLADWNGMTVAALATAGRLLGEPEMVAKASAAAEFVLEELRPEGRLLHVWRNGEAKVPGMLADYAWTVRGLLALAEATGEGRWLTTAAELASEQRRHLGDERGGYYVAEERDDLLLRSKEVFDGALPAANAVAALNALHLAEATGEERWQDDAEATLAAAAPLVEQYPDGGRMMALATARWYARVGAPEEAVEQRAEAAGGASPALAEEAANVAEVSLDLGEPGDGGARPFRVVLDLLDGWHVHAHDVDHPDLIPTALTAEHADLTDLAWSDPTPWAPEGGDEIAIHSGRVQIEGTLTPTGDAAPVLLLLTYQPCDDARCLPPVTERLEVAEI